jgi:hypothetical protein
VKSHVSLNLVHVLVFFFKFLFFIFYLYVFFVFTIISDEGTDDETDEEDGRRDGWMERTTTQGRQNQRYYIYRLVHTCDLQAL